MRIRPIPKCDGLTMPYGYIPDTDQQMYFDINDRLPSFYICSTKVAENMLDILLCSLLKCDLMHKVVTDDAVDWERHGSAPLRKYLVNKEVTSLIPKGSILVVYNNHLLNEKFMHLCKAYNIKVFAFCTEAYWTYIDLNAHKYLEYADIPEKVFKELKSYKRFLEYHVDQNDYTIYKDINGHITVGRIYQFTAEAFNG